MIFHRIDSIWYFSVALWPILLGSATNAGIRPNEKIHRSSHDTYTAAVVEYHSKFGPGSIFENTANIVKVISSADTQDVDILVFPEACVNDVTAPVPINTQLNMIPCFDDEASMEIRQISCAARAARTYVVVGVLMKDECSIDVPCLAGHDFVIFNTAVVFDRHGAIIAKYRKFNLFAEQDIQKPPEPEAITFRTDFNVTFGIFICFDSLFMEPTASLLRMGVTNFVYPTFWFSRLPFLTSVQIQQSWAATHNVNLLAANVNHPSAGASGSGIYSGRAGALDIFVSGWEKTKILKAQVPYTPSTSLDTFMSAKMDVSFSTAQAKLKIRQEDMNEFAFKFLDFSHQQGRHKGNLCHGKICCRYDVEATMLGNSSDTAKSYSYAITAYDGVRSFRTVPTLLTGHQVCSLVACTNTTEKRSCGRRFDADENVRNRINIERLELTAEMPSKNQMVMANTITTDILPLNPSEYKYHRGNLLKFNKQIVNLKLNAPKMDLLTFAIYSRDYSQDIFDYKRL